MQQLAATIEPGLHPGQSSGWCTVAQPGQQPVNDPHQGEGDAHDAAVIMRGNANVTAFNGEADEPAGGKQQDGSQYGSAQGPQGIGKLAQACQAQQGGQYHGRDGHSATQTHGPGVNVAVLDTGYVMHEISQ